MTRREGDSQRLIDFRFIDDAKLDGIDLELIGEFTRIISFAFRIFGNIFGGEVILAVMSFFFAYLLPLPFYGLEVFVAFIQAVIFAVLTVIFGSVAMTPHGGHDDHGAEAAH